MYRVEHNVLYTVCDVLRGSEFIWESVRNDCETFYGEFTAFNMHMVTEQIPRTFRHSVID
jgi:hypothetical protein